MDAIQSKSGLIFLLVIYAVSCQSQSVTNTSNPIIEITAYNLKPGTRERYHRLAHDIAIPMLRRKNIVVVSYGPSLHNEDTYFLIRSFKNMEERETQEKLFYESKEWVEGPRNEVLGMIIDFTTLVIGAEENGIQVQTKK